MTRNGKIARLPLAIRLELHHRLQDGHKGRDLVSWLNGLPEVQAMMQAQFKGEPITECNFTRWKNGGHRLWEQEQGARDAAVALLETYPALRETAKEDLSDKMALFLKARMAVELNRLNVETGQARHSKIWREVIKRFIVLRRSELQGERLRLQREKLGLQRQMSQSDRREEFSGPSGAHPALNLPR